MSKELSQYKNARISEITKIYNSNVRKLNSVLAANLKNAKKSRISNKNQLMDILLNNYKSDLAVLRKNFDDAIQKVHSFTPQFKTEKKSVKTRKALLVGINYINTPYQLSGCIDDTTRMKDFLKSKGFEGFRTLTDLTATKATKTNILTAFRELITTANAGDLLFFYFSGHGSYTMDRNNDETDRKDEMIIASDLQGVLDDEFMSILKNMPKDVTLIGLFDSCHSGTMFDLKYMYLDSDNFNNYSENSKTSECPGNVIMISGCMDSQTSSEAFIENKPQGALTWSLINSVNKSPNCSWRELLQSMRDTLKNSKFSQIPQLSTDSFYDIDTQIFI